MPWGTCRRVIRLVLISVTWLVGNIDAFLIPPSVPEKPKVIYGHLDAAGSHSTANAAAKVTPGWAVVVLHLSGCLLSAIGLSSYEDFDCRNLKPSLHLRQYAVRGMGEGRAERMQDWRHGNVLVGDSDTSVIDIPSYNEVMQKHRDERIPSWNKAVNERDVRAAVNDVFQALTAVNQLKLMADDYRWDGIQSLIRSATLVDNLQHSCSVLRRASFALSQEARNEIGFDWGSCAWRHCGAEADAQEALAELYNLSGVLEPFECRFVLDIVERSLRDILAAVPIKYYDQALDAYQTYQFKDPEEESSNQDLELLRAVNEFRNPQWDDE
ncbi:hypothetical protein MHU86_16992 [Fragilaria crotonensis]|nr:hypothetical protein MHU86_16992 [Fragilaria crotonensis]